MIKKVYGAFNPTGVTVAAFGPPTSLELRHDFLWRVHQVVPPRGMIGIFNRSHYEDVLAVRVRELAPESVWRLRYAIPTSAPACASSMAVAAPIPREPPETRACFPLSEIMSASAR